MIASCLLFSVTPRSAKNATFGSSLFFPHISPSTFLFASWTIWSNSEREIGMASAIFQYLSVFFVVFFHVKIREIYHGVLPIFFAISVWEIPILEEILYNSFQICFQILCVSIAGIIILLVFILYKYTYCQKEIAKTFAIVSKLLYNACVTWRNPLGRQKSSLTYSLTHNFLYRNRLTAQLRYPWNRRDMAYKKWLTYE